LVPKIKLVTILFYENVIYAEKSLLNDVYGKIFSEQEARPEKSDW